MTTKNHSITPYVSTLCRAHMSTIDIKINSKSINYLYPELPKKIQVKKRLEGDENKRLQKEATTFVIWILRLPSLLVCTIRPRLVLFIFLPTISFQMYLFSLLLQGNAASNKGFDYIPQTHKHTSCSKSIPKNTKKITPSFQV